MREASINRLTGVTGASGTSSFAYNGLGDRYMQVINSVTTTYQLDLAAGLVNVLADGENTYLYGNTVLAQVSDTQTGYYLPDVLGSVRQTTSPTGEVQLSQRFTPFGEVKEKYGDVESAFGYTGQMYDEQTGLLYLRARYYAPGSGRFVNKDTWGGNPNNPMSYNRWNYTDSNPINRCDASGNCWYPNFQTGQTVYDAMDSNPGPCDHFINNMASLGYAIPRNATPENWINNIPEKERRKFIKNNAEYSIQSGNSVDVWVLIQYNKKNEIKTFSKSGQESPLYEEVDSSIPGLPLPIVVGGGYGLVEYCESGSGCIIQEDGSVRIGVGIAIPKLEEIHAGIQIGEDISLYAEAEVAGQDCGVNISPPYISIETPVGEFGIGYITYKPIFILTTESTVAKNGGYLGFGSNYINQSGYDSYSIEYQSKDYDVIYIKWMASNYHGMYNLRIIDEK